MKARKTTTTTEMTTSPSTAEGATGKKKSAGGGAGGITKRRRSGKRELFGSFLKKLLNQLSGSEIGISGGGMYIVNGVVVDVMDRLIESANKYATAEGKSTLKAKHVQSGVHATMSGKLHDHAVSEGTKALTKYLEVA